MRLRKIIQAHIDNEKRIIEDLKACISDHSCRFGDGQIIDELRTKNTEQNGSLVKLAAQGEKNTEAVRKILSIAEGRRSLWKEVGIASGIIIGALTLLVLGIELLIK